MRQSFSGRDFGQNAKNQAYLNLTVAQVAGIPVPEAEKCVSEASNAAINAIE